MELEADDLGTDTLAQDTAPHARPDPAPEPEHVKGAVREAYERAKEVAEAAGDPEKLEAIRVRRAKDGRFEPKGDDARETPKQRPDSPQGQEKPIGDNQKPAPEDALPKEGDPPAVLKPPVGWNAQARADFAKLPTHVQQAVAQREAEVNKGFAILAEYKGLEQFTPVIKASGLTHAQFTENAVNWERSLKSNPIHTIMRAAQVGGVDMVRLARDIVARSGGQPQQGQAAQPQPQAIQPQQIEQIVERRLTARERAVAEQKANQTAQEFLADPKNVHAEAVVDDMVALIQAGRAKDLPAAYEMACWARPDIRALLIKQQSAPANPRRAADQARSAARTTVGAPTGRPPAAQSALPQTRRDAVREAYRLARENS